MAGHAADTGLTRTPRKFNAMNFAASLPSLAGKVALVTGANTGIGRVTAVALARQGAQVFLACRSAERTRQVLEEIQRLPGVAPGQVQWLPLELGDLASVRECARLFLAQGLPLHLLINNAGLAGARGLTPSGFEMSFGVNHLGHFLLTQLLLDRLQASAPARIVTVSSRAHRRVDGLALDEVRQPTRSRTGVAEYGASKLANLLFSAELGRRLAGTGVTTYAVHPGIVASDIWRTLPRWFQPIFFWARSMISVEQGAQTTLYCATAPALATETGLYYSDGQPVAPTPLGQDVLLAKTLWARSEAWVGELAAA